MSDLALFIVSVHSSFPFFNIQLFTETVFGSLDVSVVVGVVAGRVGSNTDFYKSNTITNTFVRDSKNTNTNTFISEAENTNTNTTTGSKITNTNTNTD